ncbi:phosphate/phosphite/phosphonate ABC transporter substrate-binding protein [Sulfurirhabdus autotrophica]|uniref:Phosphonate transport system substrate-binding protein n=1 Tax=Sulfurirhabdus autotrophica TaxID=1706046 RepID=A0A4R3Y0Z7_9PROT|nr:phosphate/phosphite/phosphonate ABC transporter substrate-binding protein [Sulfurirhabdus autotrophica]TCV84328.1 phosphonate transport system substrate-binding protein [Sulfurirhabdus autotrophica]
MKNSGLWKCFSVHRLLVLFALLVPSLALAETHVLRIGLLPVLSARVLLTNYQPLRAYLERELQQPVELVTATDFRTFHLSTVAGEYDAVVTAPHFARLAQIDAKYIPLAAYRSANRAILITSKDRPLKSINDLRGQSLAIPDRHAMVVSQALYWLGEQGMHAGSDFKLVETPSLNSAAYSVQNHQSVLAVMAPTGMKQMPDSIKDSIQVFANLPELPSSLIWMANPRIAAQVPQFKAALLKLTNAIPEGALFLESTGYIGLREITLDEMKTLDPYAKELSGMFKRP